MHSELEGLLVVSLEQAVAAPYCGLLLADAGARVIKVERPEVILHADTMTGPRAKARYLRG